MNNTKFNLAKVLDDAVQVITKPADFYRGMPRSGGYPEPLIFVVVMAVVTGLLLTAYALFGGGRLGGMSLGLASVILMPVMAAIGSFIAAAILFVIWKLMGSERSFETAYRCTAYASAVYPISAVLSIIPYIGTLVGVVWGTYLIIVAGIEVHNLERKTVYVVFGIIGTVLLISNISGERAARQLETRFANFSRSADKLEQMTPEQAGKAVGEFLKGLEQGAKGEN